MAKKIIITITKDGHETQPFKVRIEGGKSDLEIPQRFCDVSSAVRGAKRKIDTSKPFEFHIKGVLPMKGDTCITPSRMVGKCTERDTTNMRAGISISDGYTTTWVKNLKKLTIIRK